MQYYYILELTSTEGEGLVFMGAHNEKHREPSELVRLLGEEEVPANVTSRVRAMRALLR